MGLCFLLKSLIHQWALNSQHGTTAAHCDLTLQWQPCSCSLQLVQNHFSSTKSFGNDMNCFPFCWALVWLSTVWFLFLFPSYILKFPLQGLLNWFNLLSQTIFIWHTITMKRQSKLLAVLIMTLPLFRNCGWNSLSGKRQAQWFSNILIKVFSQAKLDILFSTLAVSYSSTPTH